MVLIAPFSFNYIKCMYATMFAIMKNEKCSLFKRIVKIVFVIALIAASTVALWVAIAIMLSTAAVNKQNNGEEKAFQAMKTEISRLEKASSIHPTSIDCHDVELAPECHVTYSGDAAQLTSMFKDNGYTSTDSTDASYFDGDNDDTNISVSASLDLDNPSAPKHLARYRLYHK